MKQVYTDYWNGVPIKSWVTDLEKGALNQAKNLASLPFVYSHIALMPDAHQGYGMPIGGVMATEGVVVPNAVGVDIGCGMIAQKTNIKYITKDALKKIMSLVRKAIPVGFKKHSKNQTGMPLHDFCALPIVCKEISNAQKSLGTLGGGNHFIEFQKDEEGYVWIMIHSGSRNLGTKVANHYNNVAKDLNRRYFAGIPKEWDLAFLPLDSEAGISYLKEMEFCVQFAKASRQLMLDRVTESMTLVLGCVVHQGIENQINIAHNYAAMENHFGKNVMIHRKGATLARKDTIGIIPGSQGTKSYIVRGLGNPDSFESCSHGAGRRMGRKQAQRELSLVEEVKRLNDQGIIHSIRGDKDLDEAAGAYKDIDEVMKNQKDLVTIEKTLQPIAVIKG
jgi:tRNA-splicing ligase RtcB